MKILLVYPATFGGGLGVAFPMPPLTVFHLAGLARAAGHEVDVLEPAGYTRAASSPEALARSLEGVDLLGLSCTTLNWPEARRFAALARPLLHPRARIVAGGVHATRFDERVLRSGVDVVLRGEAERSWPLLLAEVAQGNGDLARVPGASWLRGDDVARTDPAPLLEPVELGALPLPAYDLVPDKTYAILPFETSRGCPQRCGFCSITHHASWRSLAAETVVERLAGAIADHGARFAAPAVCLVDDCFTAGTAHVRDVCAGVLERKLSCPLLIEARVNDLLRDDVLDALASVEIMELQIGVECGYDEGLQRISKGTTVALIRACARRLAERGLAGRAMFSLIVGFPWEGVEDCARTLDLGGELSLEHGGVVNVSWWLPLPSSLWDARAEYGIEADDGLYDQAGWLRDAAAFERTHPRLDARAVAGVRAHLNAWRRRGAKIFGL